MKSISFFYVSPVCFIVEYTIQKLTTANVHKGISGIIF